MKGRTRVRWWAVPILLGLAAILGWYVQGVRQSGEDGAGSTSVADGGGDVRKQRPVGPSQVSAPSVVDVAGDRPLQPECNPNHILIHPSFPPGFSAEGQAIDLRVEYVREAVAGQDWSSAEGWVSANRAGPGTASDPNPDLGGAWSVPTPSEDIVVRLRGTGFAPAYSRIHASADGVCIPGEISGDAVGTIPVRFRMKTLSATRPDECEAAEFLVKGRPGSAPGTFHIPAFPMSRVFFPAGVEGLRTPLIPGVMATVRWVHGPQSPSRPGGGMLYETALDALTDGLWLPVGSRVSVTSLGQSTPTKSHVYTFAPVSDTVDAWPRKEVFLKITGVRLCRFRCVSPDGQPVIDVQVKTMADKRRDFPVGLDAEGVFELLLPLGDGPGTSPLKVYSMHWGSVEFLPSDFPLDGSVLELRFPPPERRTRVVAKRPALARDSTFEAEEVRVFANVWFDRGPTSHWTYASWLPPEGSLEIPSYSGRPSVPVLSADKYWFRLQRQEELPNLTVYEFESISRYVMLVKPVDGDAGSWLDGVPIRVQAMPLRGGTSDVQTGVPWDEIEKGRWILSKGKTSEIALSGGSWELRLWQFSEGGYRSGTRTISVGEDNAGIEHLVEPSAGTSLVEYHIIGGSTDCGSIGSAYFAGVNELPLVPEAIRVGEGQSIRGRATGERPDSARDVRHPVLHRSVCLWMVSQENRIWLPEGLTGSLHVLGPSRSAVHCAVIDERDRTLRIVRPAEFGSVRFQIPDEGMDPTSAGRNWSVCFWPVETGTEHRKVSTANMRVALSGRTVVSSDSIPPGRYGARLVSVSYSRTGGGSNGPEGVHLDWKDHVEFEVRPSETAVVNLPLTKTVTKKPGD